MNKKIKKLEQGSKYWEIDQDEIKEAKLSAPELDK